MEWIQPYVQKASDQQISVQHKCAPFRNNPAAEICRQADDWGADLIIVGRHGRTGLAEAFMGSVSNYVVHHAHCSVLVVQQKARTAPEN
ncbi:MAG: universal stress protein [Microcoleaceae cyanobacterium]